MNFYWQAFKRGFFRPLTGGEVVAIATAVGLHCFLAGLMAGLLLAVLFGI